MKFNPTKALRYGLRNKMKMFRDEKALDFFFVLLDNEMIKGLNYKGFEPNFFGISLAVLSVVNEWLADSEFHKLFYGRDLGYLISQEVSSQLETCERPFGRVSFFFDSISVISEGTVRDFITWLRVVVYKYLKLKDITYSTPFLTSPMSITFSTWCDLILEDVPDQVMKMDGSELRLDLMLNDWAADNDFQRYQSETGAYTSQYYQPGRLET